MSKFGLEYREETGYDVGVYCEDNNWYFHQHYVEWLEQKIEALSQHDVIKSVCGKPCDELRTACKECTERSKK